MSMKRLMTKLLLYSFVLAFVPVAGAEAKEVMQYKMVIVSCGPWLDSDMKKFEQVRELSDKIIADGYNTVIIGPFEFLPMQILDYTKTPYPEAVQFSSEKTSEQLTTFRKHLRYLKDNGIRHILLRSNSNYAPVNFWKAHQEELNPDGMFDHLLSKAHWARHYVDAMNGKAPYVVPHMQWRNDLYREFFLYSTEKVLEALPEVDGFSNNYSEVAWTFDLDKVKQDNWKSWQECKDIEATDEDFLEWVDAQYEMLKRTRGDDFLLSIRDWYIRPEALERIKHRPNTMIEIKYGAYDQPVVNYPPWAGDLLGKGYDVVLAIHMYDAEWPYPLYYYSVDHINQMFSNIFSAGFSGFTSLDYINRGDIPDNPIKLLYQKHTSAAMNNLSFTVEDAENFLMPYFGKASQYILESLENITKAQENYIKLLPSWFWRGDGLSPTGICPQAYWMFMDNPEAPDRMGFIRQNAVGIQEFVLAAKKGTQEFEKAKSKWKQEKRMTPIEVISLMQKCADDAITAMEKARMAADRNCHRILKDLIANAYVHKVLVDRSEAFIRSALYFYLSGYIWDGQYVRNTDRQDSLYDFTEQCRSQVDKFMEYEVLFRELRQRYCRRSPGRGKIPSYTAVRQLSNIIGHPFAIKETDRKMLDSYIEQIEKK